MELRALTKASVYLEQEEYYTGNEREDTETRKAINNFLQIVRQGKNLLSLDRKLYIDTRIRYVNGTLYFF